MNSTDQERMKRVLREALPPISGDPKTSRDLWPAVLKQLDAKPAMPPRFNWVWFDWALLVGLIGVTAFFPSAIPVLLYYL
jgi:hypothetical protein